MEKMGEETLIRSRWVKRLYPDVPRWYNARMGRLPDVKMGKMFAVILGYADLVYIDTGVVHIVEFKVRDFKGAIGQLLSYRQEFAKTPEFAPYKNLPISLRLVASRHDEATEELALSESITYEVFNG